MPINCCKICSAFWPRYKRLVDSIFPAVPEHGLVKSNMEKLVFYSLSSPEKLDRIGEYLYQRACNDIHRRRNGFVVIAMEAMDQLLVACHAQTLNLFVESFLRMIQKLLESSDPQLQIMATQSFVRFSNIEEDTPSYHRRYDFFVSKFSSMCHNDNIDPNMRDNIRLAGIRGLQGVVRKTVCDDLVENIWEAVHMNKIVPSLLYNMQTSRSQEVESPSRPEDDDIQDPPTVAESCLRELIGRASFGHIRCLLKPVLQHLDYHKLWVPNSFAVHTFKVIMFSVQTQYSYVVIEALMSHLEKNARSSPQIRTSVANVLSKIISIAAGESVGPSVLEIINSLLNHLRASVMQEAEPADLQVENDEKLYQETIISALGEFANHLPDYQKIEIMMFIMNKVPCPPAEQLRSLSVPGDVLLQNILLKSVLKVGTKYQTVHFDTTFPVSFLEPLLQMSLVSDPEVRLLVQEILHTLIDRHNNLEKLLKPTLNVSDLDLVMEISSRPDIIFFHKRSQEIYHSLYETLKHSSNTVKNIEAVYTTLALLCIELVTEDTFVDMLQLLINIQDMAVTTDSLNNAQKFHLHIIVASLLILVLHVVSLPALMEYVEKVIATRSAAGATHLLPNSVQEDTEYVCRVELDDDMLFNQAVIVEYLQKAGFDVTSLQHVVSKVPFQLQPYSWPDADSASDINSLQGEGDTVSLSPSIDKKQVEEDLTFESMKKVLSHPVDDKNKVKEEQRLQLSETFRTAAFDELVNCTQAKTDALQNKLNEIFNKLPTNSTEDNKYSSEQTSPSVNKQSNPPPSYEVLFPEMFIY